MLGGHGARGRRGRKVPPAPVVQPGPAQQSNPPEATDRRRQGRFHRRGRHRRQLARRRAGSRPLAGLPTSGSKVLPSPRCRPPSWTTGSKTRGEVLHGEAYFPPLAAAGEHAGPDVQELSQRGQRERAADVPALDRHRRRRACASPVPTSCPTICRSRRWSRRSAAECRVEIIVPGRHIECVRRAEGLPVSVGSAAGGRRRNLRVPADDVPHQGDGRGRAVDLGRVDQLRQPLLSPER